MKKLRQNAAVYLVCFAFTGSCADPDCAERLIVDACGKDYIKVYWRHECYTCDTWELCYKKEGVLNHWICMPHAASGPSRGDTLRIGGLESGTTYVITVKNAMGEGCKLKTLGSVMQKTH